MWNQETRAYDHKSLENEYKKKDLGLEMKREAIRNGRNLKWKMISVTRICPRIPTFQDYCLKNLYPLLRLVK